MIDLSAAGTTRALGAFLDRRGRPNGGPVCGVCGRVFASALARAAHGAVHKAAHGQRSAKRFWAKVQKSDGCWEWTGLRNRQGYGTAGYAYGKWRAHRLAWVLTFGAIPDGLQVLHRCDNPPCVNPAHLFIGTQADNMQDAAAKGRTNPWTTKLTPDDVREIRRLRREGWKHADLSERFGVKGPAISRLLSGHLWRHVV